MRADVFVFVSSNGIPFTARRVNSGEMYGAKFGLIHNQDDPLIEFYDARHSFTPFGQFVSRYYLSTLLEHDRNVGLNLEGGSAYWNLTAAELQAVLRHLGSRL